MSSTIRSFKLEVTHTTDKGERTLSFGPRKIGDIGSDISAVKLALGSVVRAQDLPPQEEANEGVAYDPNGWFDCVSGVGSTPRDVATFNKDLQSRIMKYQLDNQFFILCYLFNKFGVNRMIAELNELEKGVEYNDLSNASKIARKESLTLQVIDSIITLFEREYGQLGEATLAVMHGWLPQASGLSNEGYYHREDVITRPIVLSGTVQEVSFGTAEGGLVVDIIPYELFNRFVSLLLAQRPDSAESQGAIFAPAFPLASLDVLNSLKDNQGHVAIFKEKAPASYDWDPIRPRGPVLQSASRLGQDSPSAEAVRSGGTEESISMSAASIIYKARPKATGQDSAKASILYDAAVKTMEMIAEDEIDPTIDLEQARGYIERALQPDPLTDPDPFVVNSKTVGFFDITEFTFENIFNYDPETIKSLEDKALSKVLDFYNKPDIWYIYKDKIEFLDEYFVVGSDIPQPEHSNMLPHDIASEDRSKYWVLTTRENLSKSNEIVESEVQFYDEIEGLNLQEPLIKFIQYRTPSFRTGDPYRAYFEINVDKLNLITEGYSISTQEAPALDPEESSYTDTVPDPLAARIDEACEDLSPEENKRRFKEYRAYAAANRREIVRRFREAALKVSREDSELSAQERSRIDIDLGPFGRFDGSEIIGESLVSLSKLAADSDPKASDFLNTFQTTPLSISIDIAELDRRLQVAKEDIREAAKQAKEARFQFDPSGFDPLQEANNLQMLVDQIKALVNERDPSFITTNTPRADLGLFAPEITIHFDFTIPGNEGLGLLGDYETDRARERIISKSPVIIISKIVTSNAIIYEDTAVMAPRAPGMTPRSREVHAPTEFMKPYAVGYLARIRQMTSTPIPIVSGITDNISNQVDTGGFGCADLFDPKNGIAYLLEHTFNLGISASGTSTNEDEAYWHKAGSWAKQGAQAQVEWAEKLTEINFLTKNVADTPYGKDEILSMLGDTCNAHLLKEEIFKKLNLTGLLCDYLKCAKLPGFSIKIPNFNIPIPDRIPIFGFDVDFLDLLYKKLQEIINRLICTFLRTILQFLEFPFCADQFSNTFGSGEGLSPFVQKALADAMFNLRLENEDREKAADFIDASLRTLSGEELCRLFSGEPIPPSAVGILERLSQTFDLQNSFQTHEDIIEFFDTISSFVPSTLCDALQATSTIAGAATCETTTEVLNEIRRKIMANDNVQDDEIRRALELAEQNLLDEFEAQKALSENGLAPIAEELFRVGDSNALFNSFPNSLNEAIERTTKGVFEKAKSSYVNSLGAFVPNLSTEVPSVARPGDPNFNATAVLRFESAAESIRRYASQGDRFQQVITQESIEEQFQILYSVYEAAEYIDPSTEERSFVTVKYRENFSPPTVISVEQLKNLSPEDSAALQVVLSPIGFGEEVTTAETQNFKDLLVFKDFFSEDAANIRLAEGQENEFVGDKITLPEKQNKLLERLRELSQILEREAPKVFATQTKSEYMVFLKDVHDIAQENRREYEGRQSVISTSVENVLTLKFPREVKDFGPEISLKEFGTYLDKDSQVIIIKDNKLFPEEQHFRYCDPIPEEFQNLLLRSIEPSPQQEIISKREVFAQQYLSKINEDLSRYSYDSNVQYAMPSDSDARNLIYGPGTDSLYQKSFEGIMEQIFFKLRGSRMFDEAYGQRVGDRIRGRYIDETTGCLRNRFNLSHYGILSFDKMVIEEIPDLVATELAKPENQPQNLDYSKPGPIESAIQVATLKGFVRICLIELMLKGSIPYSEWDVEGVLGDQFYSDFISRYVYSELQKSQSLKDIWRPVAEKITNISDGQKAVDKMVSTELLLMPDLSKKIYNNVSVSYRDWFINNIPNVDVSSDITEEIFGNRQLWKTSIPETEILNDPFLSIEHYIRVEGGLADFSNLTLDTTRAFDEFLAVIETEEDPSTNLTLKQTTDSIFPPSGGILKALPDSLLSLSMQGGDFAPDLSFLDGTEDPLEAWKNQEIYSIEDLKNLFTQINGLTRRYDNAILPKFGFISTENLESKAHHLAEVIKRSPGRFIKRQRQVLNVSNAGNPYDFFDHKQEDISSLFNTQDLDLSLSTAGTITRQMQKLFLPNSFTKESNRFYLIPMDGETTVDYTSDEREITFQGLTDRALLKSLYNVDHPDQDSNTISRGYKMLGIGNTNHTPLDPDAPWLNVYRYGADGTRVIINNNNFPNDWIKLRNGKTVFLNVYGEMPEQDFNELETLYSTITDAEQENTEDLPEKGFTERWVETVVDLKGHSSIIFNSPGASDDQAISTWPSQMPDDPVTQSFKKLLDYLEEETDLHAGTPPDEARKGQYIEKIINPGNAELQNLVLCTKGARENITSVGLAHSMGYNPYISSEVRVGNQVRRFDRQVLFNKIEEFARNITTGKFSATDRGLNPPNQKVLGVNDYIVPVRILITQVVDDRDGAIKEVFSKVVTPRVMEFSDTSSVDFRKDLLKRAIKKVIDEYIEMIENAYATMNPDSTDQTRSKKYNDVIERISNFPYFIRQSNLQKRDNNRKSFCSVSKIYSYACKIEADEGLGNFSNNQADIDKLFADCGYLMKDNKNILKRPPNYLFYTNPGEETSSHTTGRRGYIEGGEFKELTEEQFQRIRDILSPEARNIAEGQALSAAAAASMEQFEEDTGINFLSASRKIFEQVENAFLGNPDADPTRANLGNINYALGTVEEVIFTDELGKRREHFKNLKSQQRYGLNFLYNTALNMNTLPDRLQRTGNTIVATPLQPARLRNKLAISIANILHWFKQRRVESFWGRTTMPSWLPEKSDVLGGDEYTVTGTGRYGYYVGDETGTPQLGGQYMGPQGRFIEITQAQFERVRDILLPSAGRIRSGIIREDADRLDAASRHQANAFEEDTGLDFEDLSSPLIRRIQGFADGVDPEIFYADLVEEQVRVERGLVDISQSRYSTNWDNNSTRAQVEHIIPSVEIPDMMCGFSPFLGDDRYNPDEFFEAYKSHRMNKDSLLINLASQRILTSPAFIRYRDDMLLVFRFLKKQLQNFEFIVEDRINSSRFVDDIFTANNTDLPTELIRFKDHFTEINLYLMNSLESSVPRLPNGQPAVDPLNHVLDFTSLNDIALNGFPGMERHQKIATFFSRDKYNLVRDKIRAATISNYYHLYRFGFGNSYTNHIQRHAKTFLRRSIQKQHDSWVCALEETGVYYFYNKFKDTFMTELYRQTDSLFDSSVVNYGVRLMHNTPSEDSTALFESIIEKVGSEAYGNLSNEERCYKTVAREGEQKYLYSHPLASHEEDVGFQNFSIVNIQNQYIHSKNERLHKLIEKPECKLALEYIFPVKRYMSIATVFSTSILGGYGKIPADPRTAGGLLTGAKSSLASVFLVCSLSPKEKLNFMSDVTQSEMLKMNLQSSLSDGSNLPCFPFPFDTDLLKMFVEDLYEIIKQMPSIVLRGIANVLDPAYKEMRYHYSNCNLKNLRNSDLKFITAGNTNEMPAGLIDRTRRRQEGGSGHGKYAPIFPTALADMYLSAYLLTPKPFATSRELLSHGPSNTSGWEALGTTVSRMLSYSIGGPLSMMDLSFAFAAPCMEVDVGWDLKWKIGQYGRYGHPMTVFTNLALATPEIKGERELVKKNCSDLLDEDDLCDESEE